MENNKITMEFGCDPRNESVARVLVAAVMTRANPTLSQVEDVKTAVSEAVTNSIIHGYNKAQGKIRVQVYLEKNSFYVSVKDWGCGIENVDKAMEPMYTSVKDGSRSGMGFSFMEAFMDDLQVISKQGEGTEVHMKKIIDNDREFY
jgi:stage II sporulation protein AB (anti-sigma F factor)